MPEDKNTGVTPQSITPEVPHDVQKAHDAVMGYTRSGLWLKVGKIVIAASLAAIIVFYLISRIFTIGDAPAIAPTDPNQTSSVVNGVNGTNGEDGEKGDKGEKGDPGPMGPPGPAGSGGGNIQDNTNGNFVIALDKLNKGIAISEHKDLWNNTTPYLHATALKDCWNITYSDIPTGLDSETGGTKNGKNYFAYTFFLKNNSYSQVPLDYNLKLKLTKDRTGAVGAIRFQLYEDGVSTIYGKLSSSSNVEPFACDKAFTGDVNLLDFNVRNFAYNQVKRYTIVLWYEGNDPECVDKILPASIDMSMNFEVLD